MTRRIVRLPAATVALTPSGRATTLPAGEYPVAELDGTAADNTPNTELYVEDAGGLLAIGAHNWQYIRDADAPAEYSIEITSTAASPEALADLLEHIAGQLREGYTSGYGPYWKVSA